jgi:hypothetical protein
MHDADKQWTYTDILMITTHEHTQVRGGCESVSGKGDFAHWFLLQQLVVVKHIHRHLTEVVADVEVELLSEVWVQIFPACCSSARCVVPTQSACTELSLHLNHCCHDYFSLKRTIRCGYYLATSSSSILITTYGSLCPPLQ